MKIIVDAFGGDNAPLEIIKGSAQAAKQYNLDILLVGNREIIQTTARQNGISMEHMEIAHCEDIMTMHDDPGAILKEHKNSTMATGLRLLSEGAGDAFVSAGSTGALVMGATFIVKRIKGIKRVALAPVIPTENGGCMLIDCGANVECKPEMLVQFASMGSAYMQQVMQIGSPRVALANNGTEETKGTQLQIDAYSLLSKTELNFTGNIEARDIPFGGADVVVTDGFTGNIILKMYEGVASALLKNIKAIFKSSWLTKLAALACNKPLKAFKKKMDYNEYGGAPLMGVTKPVFKAHGSSNAYAFQHAIRLVADYARTGVTQLVAAQIATQKGMDQE